MFVISAEGSQATSMTCCVTLVPDVVFREVPVAVHVGSAGVASLRDGELQPGAHALPKLRQVSSVPHCQSGTFQNTLWFFSEITSFFFVCFWTVDCMVSHKEAPLSKLCTMQRCLFHSVSFWWTRRRDGKQGVLSLQYNEHMGCCWKNIHLSVKQTFLSVSASRTNRNIWIADSS